MTTDLAARPGRGAARLVLAAGVLCCALGLGGSVAGAWGLVTGLDADPVLYPKDRMAGPVRPSGQRAAGAGPAATSSPGARPNAPGARPNSPVRRPGVSVTFWWAVVGANALLLVLSLSLLPFGYGLLRRRRWARRGAQLWSVAALLLYLVPMALTVGPDIARATELGTMLIVVAAVLVPASFPLALLSFLAFPRVRAVFE